MRVILKKGSKTPVPHHLSAAAVAAASTGPRPSGSDSSSADAASVASSGNGSGNSNVGGGGINTGASPSSFAVANNKKRGRSPVDDQVQESVPQQQSEQKKSAVAATSSSSSSGRKRRHLDTTASAAAGTSTNNRSQHVRFEDQPNYLSPTAAAASIKQALAFCKPSSSGATSASASASVGSASTSSSASGGTNSSRRSRNKKQAGILRPPSRVPAAAGSATATATAKVPAAYLPEQPQASAGITTSNMGIPARQLESVGQQEEEEAAYMRSVRGRRGSSSSSSPNPEDDDARRDPDPADANDDRVAVFEAPGEDDPANDAAGMEDPATDAREENEANVLSVIPRPFNAQQSRGASPSPSSSSSSSSSRRSGRSRSNSPETSAAGGGGRSSNTRPSSTVNGNGGAGGRKKRSAPLTAGVLSQYQDALKKRGLEMVEQEGDGNCLFRAVSLQVYGDPNNHTEARKRCMDFMAKNEEHFAQFIPDEPFRTYVARKRILGVHGNNPEIQAFSELFNRPIEIYEPQNGGNPINIFQGDYKTSDDPIRLSYHDGNHYNAIVDPYKPTAGLGLGLPGLQPGLADEMQLDKAKKLSDKAEVDRALKESRLAHDRMYEKKAFAISELEAADFDLEQAVIQSSLQSYLNEEGRKRSPHHHHHRHHLHHHRDRARRQGSTPSPTGHHSSYSGGPSHRHRHHGYGPGSSPTSPSAAASRDDDGYGVSFPSVGASPSASAGFASAATARRSSSPPHSASAASVGPASGPMPAGGTTFGGDEYPQCVQELVMNGFELSKVLRAYELVGDNFDSLLSFLMSS